MSSNPSAEGVHAGVGVGLPGVGVGVGVAQLAGRSHRPALTITRAKFPLQMQLFAGRDDLARLTRATMFAVNREYVNGNAPLHSGDELSLIPPVAGGSRSAVLS